MQKNYYIVRNEAVKEYWLSNLMDEKEINEIVVNLKNSYGRDKIICYPTSSHGLEDIKIEEHNGFKRSHYVDWKPYFEKN